MKAMIFAAGMGTRLQPLTKHIPKALVRVKEKPLLEHVIERLKKVGVEHVVVNVHHLGEQIIDFLKSNDFGVNISISDERDGLLDTGGGLRKASDCLGNEPFFVHNVDVLSDVDLNKMLCAHRAQATIATLAVRKADGSRHFLQNAEHLLCGWGDKDSGRQIVSRQANVLEAVSFTGIHIIDGVFLKYLQKEGAFSIIEAYLEAAKTERIYCFPCDDADWIDVGTLGSLEMAKKQ